MGFNLHFAGQQDKDLDVYMQKLGVRRLFSQINERRAIENWEDGGYSDKLFIDSGAFSVAHSGKKVNIDDYIEYINNHSKIPIFVELDEIPFPELSAKNAKKCSDGSWDNYVYMKERVKTDCYLLPLYHYGEPIDALKRILNTEVNGELAPYIGIGGMHGVSSVAQDRFYNELFSIVQSSKNPNVKIHAFGVTIFWILEKYPFYSADSTTWLQTAINGGIMTEDQKIINISEQSSHRKENISNATKEAQKTIIEQIEKYGYTFEELAQNHKKRLQYNIDVMNNWAVNYEYKGKTNFLSNKLF